MADLTARYTPADGPPVELWKRPLPDDGRPVVLGQTEHPDAPHRADLGIADPRVAVDDQRRVSRRHATLAWDGRQLTVTPTHSPQGAPVELCSTGRPATGPVLLYPGDGFRFGRFEFHLTAPLPPDTYTHVALPTKPADRAEAEVSLHGPESGFYRLGPESNVFPRLTPRADGPETPTPMPTPTQRAGPGRADPDDLAVQINVMHLPPSADTISADALMNEILNLVETAPLFQEDESAFARHMLELTLRAIPHADAAGLVAVRPDGEPFVSQIVYARGDGKFRPKVNLSGRRVREVLQTGRGVLRVKPQQLGPGDGATLMTEQLGEFDWWVYAPVEAMSGSGRVMCVNGVLPTGLRTGENLAAHPELSRALRASQVVTRVFATLERLRAEESRYKGMRMFLPLPVRRLFDERRLDLALDQAVVPATVLFCDLRGSTDLAERHAGDLEALWAKVLCKALDLMAGEVVAQQGVIGSFLGDAVMAFWGWPDEIPPADQIGRAVQAADGIWSEFCRAWKDETEPDLARLGFGVGLAHGPAVVGKLGVQEQFKVDVIGPTVNLAARLESLTKLFGVKVLLDGPTAAPLNEPGTYADRLRRIGWVVPRGIGRPIDLYELHTRLTEPVDERTRTICRMYGSARRSFETGHWDAAARELDQVAKFDGPSKYLLELMAGRATPPDDWPRRESDNVCIISVP